MTLFAILKKARVTLGIIFFLLTLALFIDLYEKIANETNAQVLYLQFVPSLLKFVQTLSLVSAGGFVIILLFTLLMGRIYCSTICPLGIFQDAINYISKKAARKKVFFKFKKGHPIWRYSFLGIMAVAMIGGLGFIVSWLDPYSIAGRFFTYLAEPIVTAINNISATVLQKQDVFVLSHKPLYHASWLPLSITIVFFVGIGAMAWQRGRFFCNVVCPVGTFLGMTSKASLLKVKFNPDNCTKCGKCAAICKSECISIKNQTVDVSRCVTCFNCLQVCPDAALDFGFIKPNPIKQANYKPAPNTDNDRRKLIVTGLALLAGTRIYALKKNKLNDSQKDLLINERDFFPSPPGSKGVKRFNSICTACSLCVSACPTHVLQPAINQYGLNGFMQPFMDYETSFCNFDCHKCADVCPTGAILPLAIEEKQRTQMGKAVFVRQNCVVYTDETDCGACSEHCPTKAVDMVPYKNGLMIPEVNQDICIGCGACEYPCPVPAPYRAIYINGNGNHILADKPEKGPKAEVGFEDDFPF
jgi:ferredoxin